MASNETAKPNIVRFVFDVGKPQNFFTLYLGSITTALFVLIFMLALIRKRSYSIVIQLAKPDTDAHVHEYSILLKTSYKIGAGLTDGARVAVQLIGTYCDSKRFTLTQKFMRQKILHRAHVDIFILYTPMDIGEVRQIRFTLFNYSDREIANWRPCFVEVMKSTSRERWAITVEQGLEAEETTTQTYYLLKGAREEVSIFKLFVRHHQLTAPFFHPARVGVFTTFTNIIFVFFSQTTLLMSTMSVFVMANTFLGKLIADEDFLKQFFANFFPFTQLTAAVVAAILQQLELLLNNMRPCPNAKALTYWRGLWRNDHNPNLMHCNVEYDWDRSPNRFKPLVTRFSSKTSLSSVDSSSESPESSLESSDEEDMDKEEVKKNQARQAKTNSLKMIRY
ncbi:hypothetical protein V1264_008114 [Littorina saxatilis]|uniref:PLAT domain-containing protein n=1 Tax=Littorina saxatilis TaxID=31220 RepID=A0AAN9ASY7_9CAEN